MTINEFVNKLNELGFNPTTKRIEVGSGVYNMLKKTLGDFANKFQGVDFVLNTTLGSEDLFIFF